MKKQFKVSLCLILILSCLLGLCACGSSKEATPSTAAPLKESTLGRYEIQSIVWDDGTTATDDALTAAGENFVELYSDHTALLCLYGQRHELEFSDGQLRDPDNGLYCYDFSVSDGKATLKWDGATFHYIKK